MIPSSGLMQTLLCTASMQGKNAAGKENRFLGDQKKDQSPRMEEDSIFSVFQSIQEPLKKEITEEPESEIGIDFGVGEQKPVIPFANRLYRFTEQLQLGKDCTKKAQGYPILGEDMTSVQSQTATLRAEGRQPPTQAWVQEKMIGAAEDSVVQRSIDNHSATQSPPAAPSGFKEHHPETMERFDPELIGSQKRSFDQEAEAANTREHENRKHHGKDGRKKVHDFKIDLNEKAISQKPVDSILSSFNQLTKITDFSKTEKPFSSELPSTAALVDEEPVKQKSLETMRVNPTVQDAEKPVQGSSPIQSTAGPATGNSVNFERFSVPSENPPTNSLMDQIVDKAAIRSLKNRSELQVRLKPEFLGNVRMTISTQKELVAVRIVTEHAIVKDTIESNLQQLKAELQHHGLTIDKFDVTVHIDPDQQHGRDQFSQLFKDQSSPNGRQQPDGQDPSKGGRQGGKNARDDQPQRDRKHHGQMKRDGVNHFA